MRSRVDAIDGNTEIGIYYDYQSSKARRSFGDEVFGLNITVLLRATFLVFNSNNIVACNFARFAANDVKGRQVATGNGASCLR